MGFYFLLAGLHLRIANISAVVYPSFLRVKTTCYLKQQWVDPPARDIHWPASFGYYHLANHKEFYLDLNPYFSGTFPLPEFVRKLFGAINI